jgi:phosphotransferase system HPr (HPr) family protein
LPGAALCALFKKSAILFIFAIKFAGLENVIYLKERAGYEYDRWCKGGEKMMISKKITVVNEHGLHARVATRVAQLSKNLDSLITIVRGKTRARGTSVIEMLVLGAHEGSEIELIVQGGDEARNLEAVEEVLSDTIAV